MYVLCVCVWSVLGVRALPLKPALSLCLFHSSGSLFPCLIASASTVFESICFIASASTVSFCLFKNTSLIWR